MARASLQIAATSQSLDTMPLGASRFGGLPDLPAGASWPEDLTFVGQLNLADLPSFGAETPLPSQGWLYFFCCTWDYPEEPEDWSVLYFSGAASNLRRTDPPGSAARLAWLNPCQLSYQMVMMLPTSAGFLPGRVPLALSALDLTADEIERYKMLQRRLLGEKLQPGSHRLLGYPDRIQLGEMEYQCHNLWNRMVLGRLPGPQPVTDFTPVGTPDDWRLLLQMDSGGDLGATWGDSGLVTFWIRQQDFQALHFGDCCLILEGA